MENRLNLDSEVRELKLGSSFTNPSQRTLYHTLKYDFKPASVDANKVAKLDVSSNNQVTVTVPHLEGSGIRDSESVFKGNQRDYTKKECVLIVNRVTGEITLEKLHSNIQVKKTRNETKNINPPPIVIKQDPNQTARHNSKTKVSTGARKNTISFVPKHSPLQGSPSYTHKSPQSAPAWNAHNTQQTLPSIPLIGLDDGNDYASASSSSVSQHHTQNNNSHTNNNNNSSSNNNNNNNNHNAHNNYNNTNSHANSHTNSHANNHNNTNNHHTNNHNSINSINNHSNTNSSSSINSNSSNNHINHNNSNVEVTMPSSAQNTQQRDNSTMDFDIGVLSSSESSSSSSSDSGSDSDSTGHNSPAKSANTSEQIMNNNRSLPTHLLTEDLCLSESNSDSDDD